MKGVEGKCCISSEPRWGVKTTLVNGGPSPQPGTKATLVYFGQELWRRKGGVQGIQKDHGIEDNSMR